MGTGVNVVGQYTLSTKLDRKLEIVDHVDFKIRSVVALADVAATLSATQMADSCIFTITPTAARTLTTDTAANIIAALPGYKVGTWFDFTIINNALFYVTLAAGTGITLSGETPLYAGSSTWKARVDSETAITLYNTSLSSAGVGNLTLLDTGAKNNLVTAINEVNDNSFLNALLFGG